MNGGGKQSSMSRNKNGLNKNWDEDIDYDDLGIIEVEDDEDVIDNYDEERALANTRYGRMKQQNQGEGARPSSSKRGK